MKYTVRFAHLKEAPNFKVGDKIKRGQKIGIVGNSGQSEARHLHFDGAEGYQYKKYHLVDYEESIKPIPIRQLLLFVDKELFGGIEPVVTTPYAEVEYFVKRKKIHFGLDLNPENRFDTKAKMEIFWNRSMNGEVLAIFDDPEGYGHCLYIGFEA